MRNPSLSWLMRNPSASAGTSQAAPAPLCSVVLQHKAYYIQNSLLHWPAGMVCTLACWGVTALRLHQVCLMRESRASWWLGRDCAEVASGTFEEGVEGIMVAVVVVVVFLNNRVKGPVVAVVCSRRESRTWWWWWWWWWCAAVENQGRGGGGSGGGVQQ
eukprot:1161374-Pelagomonas_calceolata.AAC.3